MIPRRIQQLLAIGLAAISVGASATGGAAGDLPNLRPAAPSNVHLAPSDDGTAIAIRFDTLTLNVGEHHLDLAGVPTADPEVADTSQCVSFEGRVCLAREQVGQFVFHPQHAHFHFDNYASYTLRRLLPDGTPDFAEDAVVATGEKVSFCLMDTDRTDQAANEPYFLLGYYLACATGYQGISAGWGDTYTAGLDGQQIVVDGVPNGEYAIVIHVNPDEILAETDYDDNVSWTVVELSDRGLRRVRSQQDVPASLVVREALYGRLR